MAIGVIAASCLYGADCGPAGGRGLHRLGLATLLGFQLLHRLLTRYADDQEIRGDNAGRGAEQRRARLALAIIVGHAAEGSFTGWADSLRGYGLALLLAAGALSRCGSCW